MKNAQKNHVRFPVFVALWNLRQNQTTPRPHKLLAEWLAGQYAKGEKRLLLMAFRACGKSTLTALFAVWLLLQNPDLRIIVVAADLVLAQKMVRNIRRVIEKHPLTAFLVPPHPDVWSAMQFTVQRNIISRDPSVLARSVLTNITGSRADVIICDDVEVPHTSATPLARLDLREKLRELDYVLSPGGSIIYLGTPHSYDSIYAEHAVNGSVEPQVFLRDYARIELPVVDAGGNSAWPEKYPPEKIAEMQRTQSTSKFASQMLLKPVSLSDARLNPDLLKPYGDELRYEEGNHQSRLWLGGTQMVGASCWWDPAFSGVRDASVVALVFTDANGNYYLHRLLYAKVDAATAESEAAQQCAQVADFLAEYYVPSIRIESNGVGKFLPGLLSQTLRQRGMGCAVQAENSSGNKITRILEALEVPMAAGAIYAHRDIFRTSFITEMREWNPARRDSQDDALDAVAGAIAASPVRTSNIGMRIQKQNWTQQPIYQGE